MAEEKSKKLVVVPKEEAVFWLNRYGRWHNRNGEFQHKKIIDYFHACISRDQNGYYLYQVTDDCEEKVYFPHEDTALFVFDVVSDQDLILVLNTGRRVSLDPRDLFLKDDILYARLGDERARFTDRSMMKLSRWLEEERGRYYFCFSGKRVPLETQPPESPVAASRSI